LLSKEKIELPKKSMATYGENYCLETGYEYTVDHRLKICEEFVTFSEQSILDFGCGDGKYSRKMRQSSNSIIGLDIENKAVASAKEYCSDTIIGDAQYLPFCNDTFDVILLADINGGLFQRKEVGK
jgi:ubiquinone/menaquinone biosynthesis C-methylase UbiE